MTGQIPKYGKNFRLEHAPYHPELASRVYALRRDPAWFIRSDKTSGIWQVYYGTSRNTATAMGTPLPTLGLAMTRLLDGIELGFYATGDRDRELLQGTRWEGDPDITVRHGVIHNTRYNR
jgi:hypothetical protein